MPHLRGWTPAPERTRRRVARLACSVALVAFVCVVVAPAASAVSLRDLVALSQAGLSDDILVALIEADGGDFALDAPRILELRQQGLSERVILAMLQATREQRADEDARNDAWPPPEPDPNDGAPVLVIIGERPEPAPPPRREVVFVPWIPIVKAPHGKQPPAPVMAPELGGFGRFMNDGWIGQRTPAP